VGGVPPVEMTAYDLRVTATSCHSPLPAAWLIGWHLRQQDLVS